MQDIQVYIDIDMLRMPCDILDLRFVARRNREHSIERWHITKQGLVEMTRERSIEEIIRALEAGEGCKIKGVFFKHFVSNNFFITVGNEQVAIRIQMMKGIQAFDMSHKINSFMLGDSRSHEYYER